ncbi:hypothetical protein, partial [Eubacterium sp.]|uniref:hypothetical protein n=1 Tax=Eubacterium sp. TaxID=142586 RepID=UPI002A81B666
CLFICAFSFFGLHNVAEINSRRLLTGSFSTAPGGRLREKKELSSGQNLSALQAETNFGHRPALLSLKI